MNTDQELLTDWFSQYALSAHFEHAFLGLMARVRTLEQERCVAVARKTAESLVTEDGPFSERVAGAELVRRRLEDGLLGNRLGAAALGSWR